MAKKQLSENFKNPMFARIFGLILGRVIKNIYLTLDEPGKKEMERVFFSGSDKEKGKVIKKYFSNFKTIFAKEAKSIQIEITAEIENQI